MAQKTPARAQESGRRSERVLLRIPIEIKGKQADGRAFKEKAYTLVINRHGARISMKNSPKPGDELSITNIQTQMSCQFRVVSRQDPSVGDDPEWGIESLEPDANIWGIYFPTKGATPAERELIDALLECSGCRSRELAQLTQVQYRTLVTKLSLGRNCAKCGAVKDWAFSFAEADADEVGPTPAVEPEASSKPAGGAERRREKRLMVKLPVSIRLNSGEVIVTRTENVSKKGVCVLSDLTLKAGDRFHITVGSNETEVAARVVWRRPLEGEKKACYGIELEKAL